MYIHVHVLKHILMMKQQLLEHPPWFFLAAEEKISALFGLAPEL
jgi:hypothetical protein